MPNLSIKNVPEHVVARLRQRAIQHHRSLQGELLNLVCRSIEEDSPETTSTRKENESSGWLSIEEVAAELKGYQRRASTTVPLAVDLIRQDRDAR